jgi:rod shape-determining protein MreD
MVRKAITSTAFRRFNNPAARLLPIATTVVAMLFSIQPIHIPGYAALTPAFTLMATYHWTIYRPDLLPPLALFIIATVHDLLTGTLPGVTALLLLLAQAIVLSRRDHFIGRSFWVVWIGFALLAAATMLLLWALNSMLAAELLDFRSTAFRAVLTISVFPIASFLLGRTQRAFMGAG